jgi:hypothetical protein
MLECMMHCGRASHGSSRPYYRCGESLLYRASTMSTNVNTELRWKWWLRSRNSSARRLLCLQAHDPARFTFGRTRQTAISSRARTHSQTRHSDLAWRASKRWPNNDPCHQVAAAERGVTGSIHRRRPEVVPVSFGNLAAQTGDAVRQL